MKNEIIVLVAVFALAIAFGCTSGGNETNNTSTGVGYTISAKPQTVISEGVVTIELRLKNIFDNDMKNVHVSLKDMPGFSEPEEKNIDTIMRGQEYPIIWSLTAPETDLKQTVSPKVEVCFDYTTNFYFDTAITPKNLATEEVQTQSSYSNSPLTVSPIGLDKLFLTGKNSNYVTGSLDIKNNWIGKIKEIKEISITPGNKLDGGIKYASCGSDTSKKITPNSGDCSILSNSLAISNGLISTVKLTTDYTGDTIKVSRTNGVVKYTYCYDIDVGTITVCPVGQRC
jgi:hypothetical protein